MFLCHHLLLRHRLPYQQANGHKKTGGYRDKDGYQHQRPGFEPFPGVSFD
jgi:hypothetical protein